MINNQLVSVLASVTVTACVVGTVPIQMAMPLNCSALEKSMTSQEITIRETTQPNISEHLVGVSNIWERDLPDDQGVIAPRLSASLSILNIATQQKRNEKVFVGSIFSLGIDRYCVVNVEEGKSTPGKITLRKIP